MRFDKSGRNVTDYRLLWSDSDCEICETQYGHPDIKGGQHHNGPRDIFIRRIGGDWIRCHEHSVQRVVKDFVNYGVELFEMVEAERRLWLSLMNSKGASE